MDVSDALQDDVLVGELVYTSDEKMKSIISIILIGGTYFFAYKKFGYRIF